MCYALRSMQTDCVTSFTVNLLKIFVIPGDFLMTEINLVGWHSGIIVKVYTQKTVEVKKTGER
jgi:hypothetical protein